MNGERHKKFYRAKLDFFTKNMRINHLLSPLYSNNIISQRDFEELTCVVTNYGNTKATEKLFLDVLLRRPDIQSMYNFVHILYENEHQNIIPCFLEAFPELQNHYLDLAPSTAAQQCSVPYAPQQVQVSAPRGPNVPQQLPQGSAPRGPNVPQQLPQGSAPRGPNVPQQLPHVPAPRFPNVPQQVHNQPAPNPPDRQEDSGNYSMNSNQVQDPEPGCVQGVNSNRLYAQGGDSNRSYAIPDAGCSRADHKKTDEDRKYTDEMSKYVCNIVKQQTPTATGFIIGSIIYNHAKGGNRPHFLLMTNRHVYERIENGLHHDPDMGTVYAVFKMDLQDTSRKQQVQILPYLIASDRNLDYAVLLLAFDEILFNLFVRLELRTELQLNKLGKYIYNQSDLPSDPTVLALIGHPEGEERTIDDVVTNNVEARTLFPENIFIKPEYHRCFYRCTSRFGSSGAPCFNIKMKRLVCMQCGDVGTDGCRMENGVLLYHVIKDIERKLEERQGINILTMADFNQIFPDF